MIDVYCGEATYAIESEWIFKRKWIFICLTTLIRHEGDYVVRKIGGIDVLLINIDGHINAFENICPHRGINLKNNAFGNGKLACDFHAWTFNPDGGLHSVPYNKQLFCFSDHEFSEVRLKKYHVEIIGKFVFVNLSEFPHPIEKQIDCNIQDKLSTFSAHMDDTFSIATVKARANWKLIIEITMDELHVPFVHAKTLAKLRKYTPNDFSIHKESVNFENCSNLSFNSETPLTTIKQEEWYPFVNRMGDKNVYYDLYIYPNLHVVCSDGGYSFSYEAYFPEESGTRIDYLFCTSAVIKESSIFPIVHFESLKYGLTVYKEDVQTMERVQSAGFLHNPYYGPYEYRIKAWRNYFSRRDYINE